MGSDTLLPYFSRGVFSEVTFQLLFYMANERGAVFLFVLLVTLHGDTEECLVSSALPTKHRHRVLGPRICL